jgi:hypothetical protein
MLKRKELPMPDFIAERFIAALDRANDRILADLRAVPEEARAVSPGGAARSPYAIALECGIVNTRVAAALEGKVLPAPPHDEYDTMLEHLPTFEAVAEFVTHETLVLKIMIERTDPETWGETIEVFPSRPPMTRFDAVLLALSHMAYHDGQLNFVHLLGGDTKIHW